MKNTRLYLILLALMALTPTAWAQGLSGSGTTNDPYLINSSADWGTFAQSVTDGTTYAGQFVSLNADITVSTMAGAEDKCFAGTFNGQNHTITLNMTASMQFTSLFCYADGATFQNLKVDGTINTAKKFCAGFVGYVINHGCTFTNCVSDVTINSTINGDGTHGGLVAYVKEDNSTFEGCAFTGKLLGANTTYVGGLVGFTDSRNNATVSFTNCVFHPQQVTMSGSGSQTFARWYGNNSGSVIIGANCYYSQTLGAAQGKQMRSITGGDYVTVAFNGSATTYERSGIDAYSVGIVYDSTLYAGNGETVSLNLSCTPPTGYVCNGYTATAGTLTGTANPYTLTMPNETVTIQAVLVQSATPVSYMDGDGTEYTCNYYTVLTGGGATTLAEGWYVVDDDITYTGTLTLEGNVNLILCDGKTMMVNPDSGHSISGNALTIYGQTLDSVAAGTLYVINDVESKKAIDLSTYTQHSGNVIVNDSSDDAISASDFTLNGGTVNATCTGIHTGIWAGNVIINGGTVNANATEGWGIYSEGSVIINGGTVNANSTDGSGIYASYNVIINGGTVNATSEGGYGIYTQSSNVTINGGTVNATGFYHGIQATFDLILGWANANDHILVSSYSAPEGTVSVKSGQAFYYIDDYSGEPVIISGTLDEEQIEAIGGKTLFPYAPVAYIDENGVEQYCISYTVVTDNLNFGDLPAGWYVVSDSITLNSNVSFYGDAHLILCDGASMNISCDNNDALDCFGSLTLYGQSEGTGSLTAISTDDYDWSVGIGAVNLIINGSTVTATGSNYGIYADDLMTINGGTVNATSDQGIYVENYNVTINGGTVTTNGIYSPTVTLGWCDINDSITVGSFTYLSTFTVSVKSGQAFCYIGESGETVVISGTLNEAQIEAICGKTLRPYIVPCTTPFQLEVTDISATTATLHWMGTQDSYNVRYCMLERSVGWVVATTNTTALNLTNLEPESTYLWQVQGINCGDNGTNTDWSEIATFTTLDACAAPFDLEVTNISATTATLHWTGAQESYNLRYRTFERAGEWVVVTAHTTTLNLTDLVPETEYEWQVQGIDCDGEGNDTEWSEIATFTTLEGINFAVTGYGQDNGGYYLIASPFSETNPLNITNMLSGNHDLYAFVPNPSDSLEWRNYATDTFNLIAGKGYLYANADTVTLTFSGTPYSGNGEFALVYDSTDARKCWNLVGNPFPCAAYLDRPYYVLNADGTGINPEPIQPTTPIPPCTAVFVKAVGVNDRAVFSVTAP